MSEIPWQSPLNYQYTLQKMKDRRVKQILSRDLYQGRGYKESTNEGEYGG
jgi:hypothetical protein